MYLVVFRVANKGWRDTVTCDTERDSLRFAWKNGKTVRTCIFRLNGGLSLFSLGRSDDGHEQGKKSEPASTTNLVESASAGSKFRPASDAIQQNTRRHALRRISTINEIDDLDHIDCHHLIITSTSQYGGPKPAPSPTIPDTLAWM